MKRKRGTTADMMVTPVAPVALFASAPLVTLPLCVNPRAGNVPCTVCWYCKQWAS